MKVHKLMVLCKSPIFRPDKPAFIRVNGRKARYTPLTYKLQFKFKAVAYTCALRKLTIQTVN